MGVQGEGFAAPVTCLFSNGSTVRAVNASVRNGTEAACTAPAWPLLGSNSTNGAARPCRRPRCVRVQRSKPAGFEARRLMDAG